MQTNSIVQFEDVRALDQSSPVTRVESVAGGVRR